MFFRKILVEPAAFRLGSANWCFHCGSSGTLWKTGKSFRSLTCCTNGFPYGLRRRWRRSAEYPPYVMTLHGLEERRVHVMSREVKKGRAWDYSLKNRLCTASIISRDFAGRFARRRRAHVQPRRLVDAATQYNMDSDRVACFPTVSSRDFLFRGNIARAIRFDCFMPVHGSTSAGYFYIREALRSVTPRLSGLTMTFAGCGVPPEEIQQFFGAELAGRIVVRPVVAAERMQELYAEHDIFLFFPDGRIAIRVA